MHAWSGTVSDFLALEKNELLNILTDFEASDNIESKRKAWSHSINILQKYFLAHPYFENALLVFEYVIPLSGGRRPDVIFLHNDKLYILEFKGYDYSTQRDDIQCDLYEQYFKFNSSFKRKFRLESKLVKVSSSRHLEEIILHEMSVDVSYTLNDFLENQTISSLNLLTEFESILHSRQTDFNKGIADNLDEVYSEIEKFIDIAKKDKKHILFFINGLPGSGKTMLGLKLACLKNNESIYLSGNDSLIKVFRNKIIQFTQKKNPEFIQYFKNFKKSVISRDPIHQNIFIFDEGQRAWSSERVGQYYETKADMCKPEIKIHWQGKSEAHIFLDNLLRRDWGVGIILVGNNQEIYKGEEKGLALWNEPFENTTTYSNIEVYISQKSHQYLLKDINKLICINKLFLRKNYRSYGNELLYEWVDHVLNGDLRKAKVLKQAFKNQTAFFLETTDDLQGAINKASGFYPNCHEKSLGLLKSSGVTLPKKDGKSGYYLDNDAVVTYFNGPPNRKEYCNNLRYMANEFECQGLELDFVIFYWGDELIYENGKWKIRCDLTMNAEKLKLKLNAYRVLLTRAREGMIIVFPPKS